MRLTRRRVSIGLFLLMAAAFSYGQSEAPEPSYYPSAEDSTSAVLRSEEQLRKQPLGRVPGYPIVGGLSFDHGEYLAGLMAPPVGPQHWKSGGSLDWYSSSVISGGVRLPLMDIFGTG